MEDPQGWQRICLPHIEKQKRRLKEGGINFDTYFTMLDKEHDMWIYRKRRCSIADIIVAYRDKDGISREVTRFRYDLEVIY